MTKIKDMAMGESGWCVPWALYCDEHGDLWLSGTHIVYPDCEGTSCMRITMTVFGVIIDYRLCENLEIHQGRIYSEDVPVMGKNFKKYGALEKIKSLLFGD